MDIYLENQLGGTTGDVFRGALTSGGSFDLHSASNDQPIEYIAILSTGYLSGTWRDFRPGGAWYEGTLTGRRR